MSEPVEDSSDEEFGDLFDAPESEQERAQREERERRQRLQPFTCDFRAMLDAGQTSPAYLAARERYHASLEQQQQQQQQLERLQPTVEGYPHHPLITDLDDYMRATQPMSSQRLELFPSVALRLKKETEEGEHRERQQGDNNNSTSPPPDIPEPLELFHRETHHSLWGHLLWNASRYVCKRIMLHDINVRGKTVLELGAGLGVPSVVAALSGGAARVVVTDYPDPNLMEVLERNAAAANARLGCDVDNSNNSNYDDASSNHSNTVMVAKPLLWASKSHLRDCLSAINSYDDSEGNESSGNKSETSGDNGSSGFDVIIIADCMFNHFCHDDLLYTTAALLKKKTKNHHKFTPEGTEVEPSPSCDTAVAYVVSSHHNDYKMEGDLKILEKCAQYGLLYRKLDQEEGWPLMFKERSGRPDICGPVHCWALQHQSELS